MEMATDALIRLVLDAHTEVSASLIETLHVLLDDSTVETNCAPKNIAQAAALTKLSTHTLRYYEQQGLLQPERNSRGYRQYAAADLRRLVFITRMRLSGMTMSDLRHYIGLVDQGPATRPQRRAMMLAQRDRIKDRLREVTLALEATEYKLQTYAGHPDP